jgi:hypothetical protein
VRAGGLGLNLTAAEYVFLVDPWWNPAVEMQAIDRAHRIGQGRPVFAYRLIARDTVEEKVPELQKTKRDLANAIHRSSLGAELPTSVPGRYLCLLGDHQLTRHLRRVQRRRNLPMGIPGCQWCPRTARNFGAHGHLPLTSEPAQKPAQGLPKLCSHRLLLTHGCIFVNVSMEFPLLHEPAHQAAARNKEAIETLVHELAVKAGAPDPRALAQELCLIMEGAYVTRHVTGNPETFAIARRLAERVLDRHVQRKSARANKRPQFSSSARLHTRWFAGPTSSGCFTARLL